MINRGKIEEFLWNSYETSLPSDPMDYIKSNEKFRTNLIEILKEDDLNWEEPDTHEILTSFFPNLR